MNGCRLIRALLVATTAACAGCAVWSNPRDTGNEDGVSSSRANEPASLADGRGSTASDRASDRATADSSAIEQVFADARQRGLLDTAAEAELRASLRDVPPELQPLVARSSLAVRQREIEQTRGAPSESPHRHDARPSQSPTVAADAPDFLARPTVAAPGKPRLLAVQHLEKRIGSPLPADDPVAVAVASDAQDAVSSTWPPTGDDPRVAPRVAVVPSATKPALAQPSQLGARMERGSQNHPLRGGAAGRPTVPAGGSSPVADAGRAPEPSAEVRPVAKDEWHVLLAAATRSLEEQLRAAAPTSAADTALRDARLRLLYLAADRRDDALRPIAGLDGSPRQFWIDWMYGTSIWLDAASDDGDSQRAALAAGHLREAVAHLAEHGTLEVQNLAFCRRVVSFGVYDKYAAAGEKAVDHKTSASPDATYRFTPNQEVLLYAELRNFASRPTEGGYHTALRPSYQVFDAQGRRVGPLVELDESHDYCHERRHDFFVRYHLYLPARIDPGPYKLKLSIEDLTSKKIGESSIDFTIVGNDK